jgi:hypothetical protein
MIRHSRDITDGIEKSRRTGCLLRRDRQARDRKPRAASSGAEARPMPLAAPDGLQSSDRSSLKGEKICSGPVITAQYILPNF